MAWRGWGYLVVAVACGAALRGAWGQAAGCGVAPVVARDAQPNLFSPEQEEWLGDAMAEMLEPTMRPARDATLSAHLQAIADRLVAVLPASPTRYRVVMIDETEVNGFSIAGGRIYITRKLAASAGNDDELAGVIGHEIGHIASHQFAFEVTQAMKRLLNVTALGDRADVIAKYHAMLDAEMKEKHAPKRNEDEKQDEADRIGVYAAAAAGYDAGASAQLWDRVFFVGGATGGRLSDLFGITKPTQKRLRLMRALAVALPKGCGGGLRADGGEFARWHARVVANQAGATEGVTAALREVKMTPPLRMELDQIRFSPDGKLLLAQDESSIFVLTREPLAVRYRIDARDALKANFSPDSESITFATRGLHTEQWSAREPRLMAAHEVLTKKPCYEPKLSPDGRTLLCVSLKEDDGELGLSLLDSATGDVVWEKKSWSQSAENTYVSLRFSRFLGGRDDILFTGYSPDNTVLLVGSGILKMGFDLRTRAPMKLGGPIQTNLSGNYAFVTPDRLLGAALNNAEDAALYSFPDGKVLQRFPMPRADSFQSVTNPGTKVHLLFHGLVGANAVLSDVPAKKMLIRLKTHALDEYDGWVAGETTGGGLALLRLDAGAGAAQMHAALPVSPLAGLRGVAVSADGRYLAASTGTRGGLWDLESGKQMAFFYSFTDATWTSDDRLYVELAKQDEEPRHIAEISVKDKSAKDLKYPVDDETHMRYGRLMGWKSDEKKKNWTLSLHDPATNEVVWSRSFAEKSFSSTASLGHKDLIFSFRMDSHTAKDALKESSVLGAEAAEIKNKESARLIKVVDGVAGVDVGSIVLEVPPDYAGIDGMNCAGDLLYVAGRDERATVYSMQTGKKLRQLVGRLIALDPGTGRVLMAGREGEGVVYDALGAELARYRMGSPIRFALFREQGDVVTVLTADQRVSTMGVLTP